ncbi:MAG: helix-turn-helix transcriptional regulator [Spirochaetales bacterium]|nr:helix-turn-helix transcriptional regulator [Spirochaetales bacterium]
MHDPVRELLAANIKQYRQALGQSQIQLAEKADISTSLLASIETCKKFPSSVTLNKLCDALNVKVHQLFQPIDKKTDEAIKYYLKYGTLRDQIQEDILKVLQDRFGNFLTDKQ